VRVRCILAGMFFWGGRYTFSEIVHNILESDNFRRTNLANATRIHNRYKVLENAVESTEQIEGTVAEFGVFEGDTLRFLATHSSSSRKIVGFDSFKGLPADWEGLLPKGYFETPVPVFEQANISLEIGIFENTLPKFLEKMETMLSLVHIDCDLYSSTQFVLENIRPHLMCGTIIIFDEYYGYPGWQNHEYLAWKEFVMKYGISCVAVAYSSHSVSFRITSLG